jgi:hypothetical protein
MSCYVLLPNRPVLENRARQQIIAEQDVADHAEEHTGQSQPVMAICPIAQQVLSQEGTGAHYAGKSGESKFAGFALSSNSNML